MLQLPTRPCPTRTAGNSGAGSRSKLACARAPCALSGRSCGGAASARSSLRAVTPRPRVAGNKKWQLLAAGASNGTPFDTQMTAAPGGGGNPAGVLSPELAHCDMDKFEAWWQKQHQSGALSNPNYPGNMPGSDPTFPGRVDIANALELVASWLPGDQPGMVLLNQRSREVFECFCDHKGRPAHVPESWNQVCARKPAAGHEETMSIISPCADATIFVVLDIVSFVLALAGLQAALSRYVRNEVAAMLVEEAPEFVNIFRGIIDELRMANGFREMVGPIVKILYAFNRLGGIKILTRTLADRMPWWEWFKASIVMAFVVGAWLGTDGAALIAELFLAGAALEQLVEDSLALAKACAPTTQPVDPKPKEQQRDSSSSSGQVAAAAGQLQ
ncbi:hypothetical protein PLESTB_000315900 [Pleodorina starrii]|uniref:Uncharacterized protein n=1 Tax=Pleodorina starrii TaxID=330485 RepID=A0A9W6BDQ5_9CHLO|nr:hypothetical protein PLESTM_001726000 [Pleodorina starrii]GLC49853.1 hypothetical protein PLESTB_000315900 [Pleodorina starrii]GLC77040.1 hypothetical protein PLESTF_001876700 [Pleodorina starrii]